MCGPANAEQGDLEQHAVAVQRRYIAALVRLEHLQHEARLAPHAVARQDLDAAQDELDWHFATLRNLIAALGYVPRTFTARLPPEPGSRSRTNARRSHR